MQCAVFIIFVGNHLFFTAEQTQQRLSCAVEKRKALIICIACTPRLCCNGLVRKLAVMF